MEISDEELVARAITGDGGQAFEDLVRRHQGQIRGWLRQLTGDAALADDLAQDVFFRIWERLPSFSGSGRFSGWLMKIAYNIFLDERRASTRYRRLQNGLAIEYASQNVGLQSLSGAELAELPKMLSVLSDEERSAILLCYAYGYSHSEASDLMEIPLGSIKSHIRRGKEKIRGHFRIVEESK